MIYVVADPGSCHNNKKTYGYELIQAAKDSGADAVKFQMFGSDLAKNGNLELSFDLFRDFYFYGKKIKIDVTASAFTKPALEELFRYELPFIKFAYSKQFDLDPINACLRIGKKTVVSSDVMNVDRLPRDSIKLYCVPEYPVKYKLSFEGIFEKFHGFSDHTMGFAQTLEAANCGAKWIEKHLTLPYSDIQCPDSKFALKPSDFAKMVKGLNP